MAVRLSVSDGLFSALGGYFRHDLLFKEIYTCRFQTFKQPATSQQTQNSSSSTTETVLQTSASAAAHAKRTAKPDSGRMQEPPGCPALLATAWLKTSSPRLPRGKRSSLRVS